MELNVSTENGRVPVTVLHATGNIDSSTYMAFQSRAEELINSGAAHILVDLTDVPYMSSAGLRALQAIFNAFRTKYSDISEEELHKKISAGTYKSPRLKLLNISPQTKMAFQAAGFDMFIETFDDLNTAVASF